LDPHGRRHVIPFIPGDIATYLNIVRHHNFVHWQDIDPNGHNEITKDIFDHTIIGNALLDLAANLIGEIILEWLDRQIVPLGAQVSQQPRLTHKEVISRAFFHKTYSFLIAKRYPLVPCRISYKIDLNFV
jgi:hypothetical protein